MSYLVTGGTGSFGKAFVRRMYDHAILGVYSRDELKQWEMAKDFPEVEYTIGDVRDRFAVEDIVQRYDRVIHAAALKHVRTGELQPWEVIQTNLEGTRNVARACQKFDKELVFLSTDKAVEPVNNYGASKMLAEAVVKECGGRVVRYGNVFGSRGSILHVFNSQKHHGVFTITDKRMTRFVLTLDQAVDIVLDAFRLAHGEELVPELPALSIVDLALAFDASAQFEEIGIQPGEKLAENLGNGQTSDKARRLSIEEIRELIDATL